MNSAHLIGIWCLLAVSAAFGGVGRMDSKPLWDLADHGGPCAIGPDRFFEIPNSAIPDSYAFTIEAKFRYDDMTNERYMNIFDMVVGETGFAAFAGTERIQGKVLSLLVNGERRSGCPNWFLRGHVNGQARWKEPGAELKLTISARGGWLLVYQDDRLSNAYLAQITPNNNPIRVGGQLSDAHCRKFPYMQGVTCLSCRIWSGDEEYWGVGEPKRKEAAFACGRGWQVRTPVEPLAGVPNVFYYGDSISVGYTKPLKELTKGRANLYHWMTSIYSPGEKGVPQQAFMDIGKLADYDYVVFNNGLHSLGWTEDKVSDEAIRDSYRTLVRTLRRMAPKAKAFIYILTTPRTARAAADGSIAGLDPQNTMVERLNRIAKKVMEEEQVTVINAYSHVVADIQLASGDGWHLKPPAYAWIAAEICKRVFAKP